MDPGRMGKTAPDSSPVLGILPEYVAGHMTFSQPPPFSHL